MKTGNHSPNLIHLCVVGHTNTGKTSLMRTLLRDSRFGEVKNASATTRHVEQANLGHFVALYDTPGLEDAGGVLDWLEAHTSAQQDGIDRIEKFLASEEAQSDFSQESKVLRQLINSDCALYVVDTREPVLPKYKDELTILSWCARPIMPVFNFIAQADTNAWRTMLSRRYLHVFATFDTVAFDFSGEMQLWQKLATMLPQDRQTILLSLINQREQDWQQLAHKAKYSIAAFLIDCAALRIAYADEPQRQSANNTLQDTVRQYERQLQQNLVDRYRFYQDQVSPELNETLQTFSRDPFDVDLLKQYGIRTSTGAAAGALLGLGLDALTLGTSLGLGATLGGLLGGMASNWQTISDKWHGVQTLHLDAATITLLAARNLDLWHTLQRRGHAAQSPIVTQAQHAPWKDLPEPIKQAQHSPKWSPLNGESIDSVEKQRAINELSKLLT